MWIEPGVVDLEIAWMLLLQSWRPGQQLAIGWSAQAPPRSPLSKGGQVKALRAYGVGRNE